jgi:hypothetical protein
MTRWLTTMLLLAAVPPAAWTQDLKAEWAVVSLAVDRPLPEKVQPAGARSGTAVVLQLHLPGRHPVGVDFEGSKLAAAGDDKGTDLARSPKGAPGQVFSPRARPAKEPDRVQFLVKLPECPALGAVKVRLKGTAVVLCGTKEKTGEVKDAKLVPKATVKAGPVELTVAERQPTNATLLAVKSTLPLKALEFVDAKGQVLQSAARIERDDSAKPPVYAGTCALRDKLDQATVRLTWFEEVERLQVPFDLEVGLGL